MKGMILFLTLLGANVITNGAQATDHNAKVTVKRDTDCSEQMEECEESKSFEECEKEGLECFGLAYFTEDEMNKLMERFCSLPVFCGGAKKRHSDLKRHVRCFECGHENEEEEKIPLNEITECQNEFFLCLIDKHIDNYPHLLEEGKALCESFREQAPEESRHCDEELEECLERTNDIAACETAHLECELESAR